MGSLDVKSVRERFRHLHSAASLGGASQHSMPSRASIDAYSSPRASQQSTLKQASPVDACSRHGLSRQLPYPQGAPASAATILEAFRQHREALAEASSRHGQEERLLSQPQGSPVSKASVLQDCTLRREAVQAASSNGLPAPGMQASQQDAWNGGEPAHQAATSQAEADGHSDAAAAGTVRQGITAPMQRQVQVCSSRVCGLQVWHLPN